MTHHKKPPALRSRGSWSWSSGSHVPWIFRQTKRGVAIVDDMDFNENCPVWMNTKNCSFQLTWKILNYQGLKYFMFRIFWGETFGETFVTLAMWHWLLRSIETNVVRVITIFFRGTGYHTNFLFNSHFDIKVEYPILVIQIIISQHFFSSSAASDWLRSKANLSGFDSDSRRFFYSTGAILWD